MASIVQKWQIEQHRGELTKQAGLEQAAVSIAGHQHRLARSCDGQKSGLQQACGTVDTEPGTLCPNVFSCLLLRFRYSTFALKRPPDVWEFRQIPIPSPSLKKASKGVGKRCTAAVGGKEQTSSYVLLQG